MMHIHIRSAHQPGRPPLAPAGLAPIELGLAWGAVLGLGMVRGVLVLVGRR